MPEPTAARRRPGPADRRSKPSVEPVEARVLLASLLVTSALDSGPGTFRQAILDADAATSPSTIDFAIGLPGSQARIALATALPQINRPVTVDGTTQQPNYAGTPLIVVDGTGLRTKDPSADGLSISGSGVTIQGLAIVDAPAVGIAIQGGTGDIIRADDIGYDPILGAVGPNGTDGIGLSFFASGNIIGQPGAGNLIAGNGRYGISISLFSPANLIQGNAIGATPSTRGGIGLGVQALGNHSDGINLGGVAGTTIGGTAAGAGNLISANLGAGVHIISGSASLIQGNTIGTDVSGENARPNGLGGVVIDQSPGSTIGGTSTGAGNLVSGNTDHGVQLAGGSSGAVLQGNKIGTDQAGMVALPNSMGGVLIDGSTGGTVGGTSSGAGNLVSGNSGIGVDLENGSSATLIQGNEIGTNSAGLRTIGNSGDGVRVDQSAGSTIGGPAAGARDVISGNGGNGISILQAASSGSLIQGNDIGVDANGGNFLGNAANGIELQAVSGNLVLRNTISSNAFDGVHLDHGASGNSLKGNLIGTDDRGDNLSNASDGVFMIQSPDNTVGGTAAADRNVLSGNQGYGLSFRGPGSTGNLALGNYIGVDATGETNVANLLGGVFIQNAPANTIGGPAAGSGNVISTNGLGINIQTVANSQLGQLSQDFLGGFADRNVVQRNLIGTDASGKQAFGNTQDGILIFGGSNNLIGGASPGLGNVVSANLDNGVNVESEPGIAPTTGNAIQGNIIGLDASGTIQLGNGRSGVDLFNVPDTLVGGTATGAGNVISGNTTGISILASGSGQDAPLGDLVQGNTIGLGADGEQLNSAGGSGFSLRNTGDGIDIGQDASGVTVGGSTPGAANVISGNGSSGIRLASGATGDSVEGNLIGVARDGHTARGNNQSGLFIGEAATAITIGGTTPGSGNVISGNSIGVTVTNAGTSRNLIEGNTIGLARGGSVAVGNLGFGVLLLDGITGNTIGGSTAGSGNVISGNGQGIGIVGPGATGNLAEGNIVGLDATGSTPLGNLQLGIFLNGAAGNTIGGTATGAGNVVSGNSGVGILIFGSNSARNLVVGNLVGLDATGSRTVNPGGQSLGNAGFGVSVSDAPFNTIGGTAPGSRNTISGNRQAGVDITGPGSANVTVQGNFIGLDASGSIGLGNQADGILVDNAPLAVIGGYGDAARNVISGNVASGVEVAGSGSVVAQVFGNFIGTDASGLRAVPNGQSGVFVNSAPAVTVGGTLGPLRNVVSGNGRDGIRVAGSGSIGTRVVGNYVGTDATGEAALANGNDGVLLDGTVGVTVGGASAGASNLISGNTASGVEFNGQATAGDVVEGNRIGTDAAGSVALGNATGVLVGGSPYNVIGGTAPFSGNLISGNAGPGVHLLGPGALNNAVLGNRVGTDATGTAPLANQAGVFLDGAPGNLVGNDLLSGNAAAGAIIQGVGATGNVIFGCVIGLDALGSRAIGSVSPQTSGVLIIDAPRNVVGGPTPGARNLISGNVVGVVISGFNAAANILQGDLIGTDAAGRMAVPNQAGVYINGSSSNTVGGTAPGAGNLISGNTATGIDLYGTLTTGNLIQGNRIGTDATGSAFLRDGTGVYIELGTSNTIGGATPGAGNLISGNAVAGVYLFNQASGNVVQANRIGSTLAGRPLGNLQYGVLLFNAANNVVDRSKAATGNLIANSGIGNFREFTGSAPTSTTTAKKAQARVAVKAVHPAGPRSRSRS